MTALNEDLTSLNFQFLMLARECARNQPMDAIWKFNLNAEGIEKLSAMSIDELSPYLTPPPKFSQKQAENLM